MKKTIFLLFLLSSSMEAYEVYGVILAGGVGERLWPLSRQKHPKQFLPLGGNRTLLEQSIDRLHLFVDSLNIWTVVAQQHEQKTKDLVQNQIGTILVEPEGRNTAPAILYCCLELAEINPDAVVFFVPADPFIPSYEYKKFANYAKRALEFAHEHDRIVLLGVQPTYPATGYGYIEFELQKDIVPYPVSRFHEKPTLKLAENYIKQENMLWNIGIFCGKVSTFINEFKNVAPTLFEQVEAFREGKIVYGLIESISIDYAVIEKSNQVSVLPVDFSWCDVGNVQVFLSIEDQFKKLNKPIEVDAKNNLVDVPHKTVAIIGVSDLCVVETDDALLITNRHDAEKVRNVVKELKQTNQTGVL